MRQQRRQRQQQQLLQQYISALVKVSAQRILMVVLLSAGLLANCGFAVARADTIAGGNADPSAAAVLAETAGAVDVEEDGGGMTMEEANDEASRCSDPVPAELDSMLLAAVTATTAEWPALNDSVATVRLSSTVAAGEITECCRLIADGSLPLRQRSACPWYLYYETDPHRYPHTVIQARYLGSSGCNTSCAGQRSCQSVKVHRTVLRYTGACISGVKVYAPARLSVTVGYVCALSPPAMP